MLTARRGIPTGNTLNMTIYIQHDDMPLHPSSLSTYFQKHLKPSCIHQVLTYSIKELSLHAQCMAADIIWQLS